MSDERKPIVQVLRSSVILIRLSVCSFCWITNTFVYYGLSLNSVAFAGDKYINFILVTMVEIPGYCFTWLLTDRIGRKPMLSGAFLLSGIFCLAIQFVPTGKKNRFSQSERNGSSLGFKFRIWIKSNDQGLFSRIGKFSDFLGYS